MFLFLFLGGMGGKFLKGETAGFVRVFLWEEFECFWNALKKIKDFLFLLLVIFVVSGIKLTDDGARWGLWAQLLICIFFKLFSLWSNASNNR